MRATRRTTRNVGEKRSDAMNENHGEHVYRTMLERKIAFLPKRTEEEVMREIEEGSFNSFVGASSLQPLSESEAAAMNAYLENVRANVVPVTVEQVIKRERMAVEARKLFVF